MAEPVTARQNAIYDCTHIYLDAFDKKGPIGDLYCEAVAEYLERFIKTENPLFSFSISDEVSNTVLGNSASDLFLAYLFPSISISK